MPFCPNCRFEYVPEVTRCPDCGADLVETLPDVQPKSEYREAELGAVTGEISAKLLQDALAAQDIPSRLRCYWPNDNIYGMPIALGDGPNSMSTVIVRESDLARARTIYSDLEGNVAELP